MVPWALSLVSLVVVAPTVVVRAIVVEMGPDRTQRFRLNQTKTNPAEAIGRMFTRSGPDPVALSAIGVATSLARTLDPR